MIKLKNNYNTRYSTDEINEFEILTLWIRGLAGVGGNEAGEVYDKIRQCPKCKCEKMGKQVGPLLLYYEKVDHMDICVTQYGEHVCSNKSRELVKNNDTSIIKFKEILLKGPVSSGPKILSQFFVEPRIGPIVETFPLSEEDLCSHCKEYANVGIDTPFGSKRHELHFYREMYKGEPITMTKTRFGGSRNFHLLVINQKFYQTHQSKGITGYWIEPAYLDKIC